MKQVFNIAISIASALGLTVLLRSSISLGQTLLQKQSPITEEFWLAYSGFFKTNGILYLIIFIVLVLILSFIPLKYNLKSKEGLIFIILAAIGFCFGVLALAYGGGYLYGLIENL